MDLYFLNFKRVLCILTKPEMRLSILDQMDSSEIDVNIKFVDSYSQAFKLIEDNPFEPYDHVILNLSLNNLKLRDFREYLAPMIEKQEDFLLEYTADGDIVLPTSEKV
jgi:hypothetical protein